MQSACTACFLVASLVIDQVVGSLNGAANPPCRLQKEPLQLPPHKIWGQKNRGELDGAYGPCSSREDPVHCRGKY